MRTNTFIVLAKTPERGRVKTRVAAESSQDLALRLYQKLFSSTLSMGEKVSARKMLFLSNQGQIESSSLGSFELYYQICGDLGEKITHAFSEALLKGADKAVIIGSDCPHLCPEDIHEAFRRLDDSDVVIGPALDGGYYLLGLKKLQDFFFSGIQWSSPLVLEQTVQKIKDHGLSYSLLRPLSDVDRVQDIPDAMMRELP